MSIDTYLFDQYVEVIRYNRLLAEQYKIIEDANRYPLSTALCYEKYLSIPIAGNNRRPIGIGSCRLPIELAVVVVVVVVVLTLTRIIKSVVTGQAPVTLELSNTPGKKHKQTRGGTRIYHN